MSELIYHITDVQSWNTAKASGEYVHDSLEREGFIHCSPKDKLEDSANLYFSAKDEVLILVIDTSKLKSPLKVEGSGPRGEFPHVYGPINIDAIVGTHSSRKINGVFRVDF